MRSYVVISDPVCLEYVLKTRSSNFVKGVWFRSCLQQLLGSGIFAVDGQEWYWQRKMASNIFNVQR
jgi:cytochrome P450